MSKRNYYEVLGLHPSADHLMVVSAYWHLARKYKAAIAHDLRARRKLEELNEAFAVIGCPDQRSEYDLSLTGDNPTRRRRFFGGRKREGKGTHRISIEVSYWRLPAWQGMMAATATLAVAALALIAGASVVITLILSVCAVAAALIPTTSDEWKAPGKPQPWGQEREQTTFDLDRAMSATVSKWRQDVDPSESPPSLANFFDYKKRGSSSEQD